MSWKGTLKLRLYMPSCDFYNAVHFQKLTLVDQPSRGQFHQHFKSSFYVRRSQKQKKDSQVKQLFALLGSAGIKAGHKHIDQISPTKLLKMHRNAEKALTMAVVNAA